MLNAVNESRILRSGRPEGLRYAVIAIAAVALALRLVYLSQLEGSPLLTVLMGDARVYDDWGMRIAGGDWIGKEIFYQTPLYPYLLGLVYRIAGHDPSVVRLAQAGLGAVSCVLLALAGRRFFDARAGIVAACLLAIYPPAIFFDGLLQKSSLDLFLVTAILALLGQFQARRRWVWLIAAAAATGALALNRENALVLLPVVGAWLLVACDDVGARIRAARAGVYVGAALLVLVPVGLRNVHVGGEFILTTSQLGPNFYIGNNPQASGSYESLLPGRGDPIFERADATDLASRAEGRKLSPREVSHYWLRRSFEYIRAQPLDWVRLSGRKLLLTLNASEISDTESITAYAESAPLVASLLWLGFGVVFPLAVFGAWLFRRDWRRLSLLYMMAAAFVFAIAAFFVVARYRHPLVPVVLLFAGAGVSRLPALRRSPREWGPGLAAAVVAAGVAYVPVKVVHDQTYINVGGYLLDNGRAADALPWLRRAVAADPTDPVAQGSLALALMKSGESNVEAALPHFGEAVRLQPDNYAMRLNFGTALCRGGRIDECLVQLREAERIDPRSIDAPLAVARAQAAGGRFDEALVSLERALARAEAAGDAPRIAELREIIRQTKLAIER